MELSAEMQRRRPKRREDPGGTPTPPETAVEGDSFRRCRSMSDLAGAELRDQSLLFRLAQSAHPAASAARTTFLSQLGPPRVPKLLAANDADATVRFLAHAFPGPLAEAIFAELVSTGVLPSLLESDESSLLVGRLVSYAAAVMPLPEALLDTVTYEPLKDAQIMACGHSFSTTTVREIQSKNGGAFVCPVGRFVTAAEAPVPRNYALESCTTTVETERRTRPRRSLQALFNACGRMSASQGARWLRGFQEAGPVDPTLLNGLRLPSVPMPDGLALSTLEHLWAHEAFLVLAARWFVAAPRLLVEDPGGHLLFEQLVAAGAAAKIVDRSIVQILGSLHRLPPNRCPALLAAVALHAGDSHRVGAALREQADQGRALSAPFMRRLRCADLVDVEPQIVATCLLNALAADEDRIAAATALGAAALQRGDAQATALFESMRAPLLRWTQDGGRPRAHAAWTLLEAAQHSGLHFETTASPVQRVRSALGLRSRRTARFVLSTLGPNDWPEAINAMNPTDWKATLACLEPGSNDDAIALEILSYCGQQAWETSLYFGQAAVRRVCARAVDATAFQDRRKAALTLLALLQEGHEGTQSEIERALEPHIPARFLGSPNQAAANADDMVLYLSAVAGRPALSS